MQQTETSTRLPTEGTIYTTDLGQTIARSGLDRVAKIAVSPAYSTTTGEGVSGVRFEPDRRSSAGGKLDAALLSRAAELLDGIENASAEQRTLTIESLRCVACELWPSASKASQYHQSILALAEGMLLCNADLNENQAAALRGAFSDLTAQSLNESYVDVLRSRFVDDGYNPLAMLSSMEAGDERNDHAGE